MLINRFISLVSAALLVVSIASCNSDTTSANKTKTPTPAAANTMNVTVDGTNYTWLAGATHQSYNGQAALTIVGADTTTATHEASLILVNITAPGTYNIGTLNGLTTQYVIATYSYADGAGSAQVYTTPPVPGLSASGTVQITRYDSVVVGTFNATVTRQAGSTGPSSETIANGAFNAGIY